MGKTYERILTTTIAQSKYVLLELLSMQIMFSIIFGAFMVSAIPISHLCRIISYRSSTVKMNKNVTKYGVTDKTLLPQTDIIPNENLKLENFH